VTGSEMIASFLQYYDRITNFSAPGYEDGEILLFLNNAQDEFVKERTFGKNFQPPAFDDNEKRVADIRPLVSYDAENTSAASIYGNSVVISTYGVDAAFLYIVKLDVRVTRTNPTVTAEYIPAREIKMEDAGSFKDSVFNKAWFMNPVFFTVRDSGIYIIGDYYTTVMDNVRLNYVRRPKIIVAGMLEFNGNYQDGYMSLEPHVHQEIVNIAVRNALQVQMDPRWQSQVGEQQIKTE
jgi:hypothetical protein